MKKIKDPSQGFMYFILRFVYQFIDPVRLYSGITGYLWYFRDIILYNTRAGKRKIKFDFNLYPILNEKVSYTPFDVAYFHQQLWAFEHIFKIHPIEHVDIASTYTFSGYVSKITKSVFLDYRPIDTSLKNLEIIKGDILNLPFKDSSKVSLSCLHVIEHIGLGRYGDKINPDGYIKAIYELQRVVSLKGRLYISIPVGVPRLCFNAHRIFDPEYFLSLFDKCKLIEFSLVNDTGGFLEGVDISLAKKQDYGCGMFVFEKL